MAFNIAIDGPAGAGKSTIAKQVARQLSCVYVDTGAMFRAMALYCIRNGISGNDQKSVEQACEAMEITIAYQGGEQQVLLNGENVNRSIRTEEVGNLASVISAYEKVRSKLQKLQQDLAASQDVIMDGRDIGTCVLPGAQVKIYLTASVETRGRRRYQELKKKGGACNLEKICADIEARDNRDMHREVAPLMRAEDAVLVDSSDMTIPQVVEAILEVVRQVRKPGTGKGRDSEAWK